MTLLLFIIFIQHSTCQGTTPTGSNFFIDNDWVLEKAYPFPVNLCIETSPELNLGFLQLQKEVTYYACSEGGQQVTKYRWNQKDTDCSDLNTADVVTTYKKNAAGTSCDLYHFECGGTENYVTGNFYISTNLQCDGLGDKLFSTSVATNVCFCESATTTSGIWTCDSNNAIMVNHTGNSCNSQLTSQSIAGTGSPPTYFMKYSIAHVCAEMAQCMTDSVDKTNDTDKATTTDKTNEDNNDNNEDENGKGGGLDGNNEMNVGVIIGISIGILVALIVTVGISVFVCKNRKKESNGKSIKYETVQQENDQDTNVLETDGAEITHQ